MKIILLENIMGLGKAGDIKSVKDGYARNFLIPQRKAEIATKDKEHYIARMAAKLAEKAKKLFDDAMSLKESLEKETLEIKAKAGEEGKLFGSITNTNIADELKTKGYEIDKKKILTDHIKTLGEHSTKIRLEEGVVAEIKVIVEQEQE